MYKIFKTPDFDKFAKKILDKEDLLELDKFIEKLRYNPYLGKPLSYPFLREKKLRGKRVYYIIYDDYCIILFVIVIGKKLQQATIDFIKKDLIIYRNHVEKLKEN